MDYIYKVEIQLFREDGTYDANLLRRKKSDCNDKWKISSCCSASTLKGVFEWAEQWVKVYGE
jgi:hypothetical protein